MKPISLLLLAVVAAPGGDDTSANAGPTRTFKTLPDPSADTSLSFIMGSCQNYAFFMNGKDGRGPTAKE